MGSEMCIRDSEKPNRKRSQTHRATSRGGCGQVSRSKSVANRFLNIFSHIWSYDQNTTHERPAEQPNRRGSQINHTSSRWWSWTVSPSRTGFPVAAISDHTQSYDGRTTGYASSRVVTREVTRSTCDIKTAAATTGWAKKTRTIFESM